MPITGPGGDRSDAEAVGSAVESLAESTAPANLFAVLEVCLGHRAEQVRNRALDVVAEDGSRQAVATLAHLPADAQRQLGGRLSKVEDPKLKAAMLRVLLIRADGETTASLLAACGDLAVTITSPQDPLLTKLMVRQKPEVLQTLLRFLGRADLTAVASTSDFDRVLSNLIAEQQENAELQKAMLALAVANFKPPYQAPLKSAPGSSGRSFGDTKPSGGFELLLANVAASPKSDTASACAGAETLVSAGRLDALNEQLKRGETASRARELIRHLSRNKALWERGALATFLASRLADPDEETKQLALATLSMMYKSSNPNDVWRLNLAVKQGTDAKTLSELSASGKEALAELATRLLIAVTQMSSKEGHDFELRSGSAARGQMLTDRDNDRKSKPAGEYACMVFLDLQPQDTAGRGPQSPVGPTGSATPAARQNVPLASVNVVVQKVGENDVRITADGRDITYKEGGGYSSSQGSLPIDAGRLLWAALRSPDAEKMGLAGRIQSLPPGEMVRCDLQLAELGSWVGEFTVSGGGFAQPTDARLLAMKSGRVILEPLAPQ